MNAPAELVYVAFPSIIGIVAEACYNDPDARAEAEKDELPDFCDAEESVHRFWRFIASAALNASGHTELIDALQQFVNGVETRMIDSPADETLANITHRAKAALAKARGEQVPA